MNARTMTKLLTGVAGLLFSLSAYGGSSLWNSTALIPIAAASTTSQLPARPQSVTTTISNPTQAQTQQAPAPAPAPPAATSIETAQFCESTLSNILTAERKFSPSLMRRANRCLGLEDEYGERRVDPDDDDYNEERENSSCKDTLNSDTCPEENAGLAKTFADEERDARDSVRDIQKDLIDAEEDLNRMKQESESRMNEINDRVEDAGEDFKKNGQDLLDQLESKIAEQDNQLRDMLNQMRAQYNKWDENYVEMRDQFRAAEQAIAQAQYGTEVQCRAEAQKRLDETNTRIKERTDGLTGKKIRQSSTSIAGSKKKRFREYERLRQTQYAEAYKLCLEGKSPAGAAANAAIKTAKDNFQRAKAKLADQQAVIENQRRQLLQAYAEAQKSSQQNKDRIAQQAQRLSQQQFESYQKSLRRAEREYQSEQRNYQNAMNLYNRRQMLTYQQMSDAQTRQFTAQFRANCARSFGGSITESAGTRKLQQYDDASTALDTLTRQCSKLRVYCPNESKPAGCERAEQYGNERRGEGRDGERRN